MYQKNPRRKSNIRYLVALILVLAVSGVTMFTLEKTGVTNFYTSEKPKSEGPVGEISSTDFTNTVDYGPAMPEDKTTIPDKVVDKQPDASLSSKLSVTITSTRKNTASTAYLIKAAVVGTESGTCSATISKGPKSFTTSGNISLSSGLYSCMNLEVPLSSLDESGSWHIEVTATDNTGNTASTSAEVII